MAYRTQCQINKLQRVQNACARLVYNESKFYHIPPLLVNLHWLPVRYRIEFKVLLITFKVLNGLAPSYLTQLVTYRPPSRYNFRNSYLSCLRFKTKATLGDRAFICAAPKLWNALPIEIRSASSVGCFKSKLKAYLFKKAFY